MKAYNVNAGTYQDGSIDEAEPLTLSDIAAGDYDPWPCTADQMRQLMKKHGQTLEAYETDDSWQKMNHAYEANTLQNVLSWLGY